jgi:predicted AAA+ superfamily ATPase
MYIKEKEIDKLYKRIMKQDVTAIDEIESLDQAKELIKMMANPTPMILKTSAYGFDYEKYIKNIKDICF